MPTIKVYTTPTCPYCVTLKKYLDEKSITYEAFDVSSNASAREEMMQKCNCMSVPVVDIDGEVILGFDKVKINKKLGISE